MNVKKYLLPKDGNFYKANLHSHTTVSDGRFTPAEAKKIYLEKGYSIVAFSDHQVLVPHSDLRDEQFLPITATEIALHLPVAQFTDTWHGSHIPQYHINLFSKKEDRTDLPPYHSDFGLENAQDLITKAASDGFLAQLNHPRWCYQTGKDYLTLENLWSVEVYNNGCETTMLDGWGDYEYELMCREFHYNNKPLPALTANDDNHNVHPLTSPLSDSFGGWTMIKAPSLDYDSIITAMENKDLYATTGPEIKELFVDTDNNVHVKCSPSHTVALLSDSREFRRISSHQNDITEAILPISQKVPPNWLRIVVVSNDGLRETKAISRAYHKSELG